MTLTVILPSYIPFACSLMMLWMARRFVELTKRGPHEAGRWPNPNRLACPL